MNEAVKVKASLALVATSLLLVGCEANEADKFFMKTYYDDGEIIKEVTGFAYDDKRRVVWAYDDDERGTIFTRYESCDPGNNPNQVFCIEMQESYDKGNKGRVLISAKEDNYIILTNKNYHVIIRNTADLFEF